MSASPSSPAYVPLWPGPAPLALGTSEADTPALARFDPAPGNASGATVLVLPGGGYWLLADHEGEGYAHWLAARGITAFVLRYRLGSSGYRHPTMLLDAARALRTVRTLARAEGRDPERIGIMGSSAGGHLASTLLTHHDSGLPDAPDPIERESSRPDLGVLCYPVISMLQFTHLGSRQNLLGDNPSNEHLRDLSNELRVTPSTPPCFLWHTGEDAGVPVENALLFAAALRRCDVPFELHVYEKGAHGLGLPDAGRGAPPWDVELERWLRERGFMRSF